MRNTVNIVGAGIRLGAVAVVLSGCAGTTSVTRPTEISTAVPAAKMETVPQKSENSAVTPEKVFLSGKVIETMNATGYTYILLENEGKTAWFAVPSVAVSVGQEVEVKPGMQMGLFQSKTLNKKFESIVFSPGLVSDAAASLPAAVPPTAPEKTTMPSGHPSLDADPKSFTGKATKEQLRGVGILPVSGKVLETMNAGGYTYVLIANDNRNIWGAVPTSEIVVGQEIELLPGQTMSNFNSKSLNKTFDSIIFSSGVVPVVK